MRAALNSIPLYVPLLDISTPQPTAKAMNDVQVARRAMQGVTSSSRNSIVTDQNRDPLYDF